MNEWISVAEIFGENVFNDAVMQERLPKKTYKELKKTIEEGKELQAATADVIAHEMKEWAIEKGATHYSHWFQPLTGATAEKHDSFISAPKSVLFTMGESVEKNRIAKALDITQGQLKKIVKEMQEDYAKDHRGIKIIELENSYQLCTKPELYETLIRVAKQPKRQVLTDVMMETLSIIAYKQPITKSEIERIRGVKSDFAVNKLVEYMLVEEVGRLQTPGRPLLFGTTEEFLRRFGVESSDKLPIISPDMIEEFKHEAEDEITLKSND